MFYIEGLYTNEIITMSDNLNLAITMSKNYPDCMVTDENDFVCFVNAEDEKQ